MVVVVRCRCGQRLFTARTARDLYSLWEVVQKYIATCPRCGRALGGRPREVIVRVGGGQAP